MVIRTRMHVTLYQNILGLAELEMNSMKTPFHFKQNVLKKMALSCRTSLRT